MDYMSFFGGVLFLIVSYFYYRFLLKGTEPSTKENNWTGPTQANYIELWGSLIMLVMCGIAFIIKSLPAQI